MPFIPAAAFNQVFFHQVWVHDGVADARRVRRWRRKARDAESEPLPQNRVRVVSPIHPSLRHLGSDREFRRV
jgi:hypothetical protein